MQLQTGYLFSEHYQVKRTCTDDFDVNFFMVNHACMTEGHRHGHMCFCEEDECNFAASLQPSSRLILNSAIFSMILLTLRRLWLRFWKSVCHNKLFTLCPFHSVLFWETTGFANHTQCYFLLLYAHSTAFSSIWACNMPEKKELIVMLIDAPATASMCIDKKKADYEICFPRPEFLFHFPPKLCIKIAGTQLLYTFSPLKERADQWLVSICDMMMQA